jgi:regulator of sirC expression with transglutaminase-like and TPR domain
LRYGTEIVPLLQQAQEQKQYKHLKQKIQKLLAELQQTDTLKNLADWKQHEQDNLLKAFWIINTLQEPTLDYDYFVLHIDKLCKTVAQTAAPVLPPSELLRRLNYVFFETLSFQPDIETFHAPENSFLLQVIERRKGNPISLAIIYMTLAQKLGLPIYGVNLPNIFVLTYLDNQKQFFINPFNKGTIFQKNDIEDYIHSLGLEMREIFYMPCSNIEIIKRVLRNLVVAFQKQDKKTQAEEAARLLFLLEEE